MQFQESKEGRKEELYFLRIFDFFETPLCIELKMTQERRKERKCI